MKKTIPSLILLLVLISSVSAEQLLCRYQEEVSMVIDKSKMYQCPPVLKKFYRLESQGELIPATSGGGWGAKAGGGGGFAWHGDDGGGADAEEPEQDATKNYMTIRQKLFLAAVLVTLLLFAVAGVLIVVVYVKRAVNRIKNKEEK